MTPPQVNSLDEAQQVIAELTQTVAQLQSQVAWLKRILNGAKSERMRDDGDQSDAPGLFEHLGQGEAQAPEPEPPQKQTVTYEREVDPARRRGKRNPIPDDLPREERIYDLPESEKAGMKRIGEEVSEQLAIDPGRMYVIRHIRYKYARVEECLDGSEPNVVVAERPVEGLPRCIAAPSLLAFISVSRFADHLPYYRQEGIGQRSGVNLARSSMCRWNIGLGAMCHPLLEMMKQRVLQSHFMQCDETPVRQQMGAGLPGPRGPTKQCYFYSYIGDEDHPYTLYDYQLSRSRAGPNGWFTDEQGKPNYHGPLVCDAYTGYAALFDPEQSWQMIHVGCWAHARRKFYDARLQSPGPCHYVLGRIRTLYAIERQAQEQELSHEERQVLRDQRSRPIVEELLAWCTEQHNQVLPRSGLGEAVTYMLGQAQSLQRYLDDGRLPIDNNACERSLRGIAIGRKNWLFTGSEAGGRAAAAMFSLIASARRHNLDPLAYLTDVFTRLSAPLSQLEHFLPD